METVNLSSKQWIELVKSDKDFNLPIWIQVISNSMFPWIRAKIDNIMVVPVKPEQLKIGDIVMFPSIREDVDFLLHRIVKTDGDRVLTMGDANRGPDGWIDKAEILGKAVMIQRGNLTIDCEAPKWVRRFRLWNRFWRIRPFMLLLVRVMGKCKRILKMMIKK